MGRDRFFKFAFLVTFFLAAGIFFSNMPPPYPVKAKTAPAATHKEERQTYPAVDLERIKTLIREERLSDRPALFYERIDQRLKFFFRKILEFEKVFGLIL